MIAFFREDGFFYAVAADSFDDFQKLEDTLDPAVRAKYGISLIEEVDPFDAALSFTEFVAVPLRFKFDSPSARTLFIEDYKARVFEREEAHEAQRQMLAEFNTDLQVIDQRPIGVIHDMDMDDGDEDDAPKVSSAPNNPSLTSESFQPRATVERLEDASGMDRIIGAHFDKSFFDDIKEEAADIEVVETEKKLIIGDGEDTVQLDKNQLATEQKSAGKSMDDLLRDLGISDEVIAEAKECSREEEDDDGADLTIVPLTPVVETDADEDDSFDFGEGPVKVSDIKKEDDPSGVMAEIAKLGKSLGLSGIAFLGGNRSEDEDGEDDGNNMDDALASANAITFTDESNVGTAFRVNVLKASHSEVMNLLSGYKRESYDGPNPPTDFHGQWVAFSRRRDSTNFSFDARDAGFEIEEYLVDVASGEPAIKQTPKDDTGADELLGSVFGAKATHVRPWNNRVDEYNAMTDELRAEVAKGVTAREFYFSTRRGLSGETLVFIVPKDHYDATGEFWDGDLLMSERQMNGLTKVDGPIPNTYRSRASEPTVVESLIKMGFVESMFLTNDLNARF